MRADIVADILLVLGLLLVAAAALVWLGIAAALLVVGAGAISAGIIIARGGIGR